MANLEKNLNELLLELRQKRTDVEELQQRYDAELLTQRELRAELETFRAEGKSMRAQLELTNKALHRSEEGHSSARDMAVRHKLSLEAATRTIDVMKEQATKLHLENVKLKKQMEDLERDMKSELFFRESCVSKQSKNQEMIESLTVQIHNLDKDYRNTERHSSQALSLGSKCQLMLEHKDKIITQLQTRVKELSAELVSLNNKNMNLENDLKEQKPPEKHYVREILQEWQTSMNEMKTRIANSEKESEILHQSLQNALNAQSKFQELETSANKRVKELEMKLQEAKVMKHRNVTDCSAQTDVKITIDIACETSIEMVDVSIQTDSRTQDSNQDITVVKQNESFQLNQNNQTPSFSSVRTSNDLISSNYLSALMSKYQLEKEPSSPTLTQDLSDMPTQPNPRLNNM
ncbi:golgin subfamily A member 5-like [Homalodisca vitripennis]|uniref:golgin subfamily A member 5-like n=1 Tax=Homalodisca vitripennis TaxID=197043 RepID=UPI001EEAE934|nr:golgin subfamily A member 5-like [Homalodisca vitripennis]